MIWPIANYQDWANHVGYSVDIAALENTVCL